MSPHTPSFLPVLAVVFFLTAGDEPTEAELRYSPDRPAQVTCEPIARRDLEGGPVLRLRACGHELSADSARAFLERRAALYGRVDEFLGSGSGSPPPVSFYRYDRLETMGLRTGRMEPAFADHDARAVHVVREPGIRGERLNRMAELLIRDRLGRPDVPILETGLWMQFVDQWYGRPPLYWTGWMHRGELRTPAARLVRTDRTDSESESYLVRRAMSAGLVDLLLREAGRERFVDEYASWTPTSSEIDRLERWWPAYLDSLADTFEDRYRVRRSREPELDFLKGFNFAHEGYDVYDGYASTRADSSLAELAEMGANAVSVLPYSHVAGLHRPEPIDLEQSARGENDASLRHVIHQAHLRDMHVLMKPHLWTGDGWIGDLAMRSEADWNQFFEHYASWILHYALLAEMEDLPLFSVGVELEEATTGHPDHWRAIIDRVRGVFSGRLVYAANWGREFEQITFWDALDYMGVDWYYPLAEEEETGADLLRRRAEEVADRVGARAETVGRPVILTEVGFPSIRSPWIRPHDEQREVPSSLEDQALSYRILREALADESWLRGAFWWKWPSDLRRGGPDHRGFTPNDKPAEAEVRSWFGNEDPPEE